MAAKEPWVNETEDPAWTTVRRCVFWVGLPEYNILFSRRTREETMGVGEAIDFLTQWMPEHGTVEGGACFACSHENEPRPPFVEYVYTKIEKAA